jgi:hypothetical protein
MATGRNILLCISLALAAMLGVASTPALGFDSAVRTPVLGNPAPGAVSVPFEIPVRQSDANPEPSVFRIAVEGFTFDPEAEDGLRIGSLDVLTASGKFGDKAIYSDGPGSGGVRTWTLDWQLSEDKKPITATVEDGYGLDPSGQRVADPAFTLISFVVPVNYHGFPVTGLELRFNENEKGTPSPGVGAVNPATAGNYLIRSRVESVAPESAVKVGSTSVRVGLPDPKTALRVSSDRKRIRPGSRVKFRLRTTNGTSDRVSVWLGGRRLGSLNVNSTVGFFNWRPGRSLSGRKVVVLFKPASGPARKVTVRVTRR